MANRKQRSLDWTNWFKLIAEADSHEQLSAVAARLSAEHRLHGVRWYETLCRVGKIKREQLDSLLETDAEFESIMRTI